MTPPQHPSNPPPQEAAVLRTFREPREYLDFYAAIPSLAENPFLKRQPNPAVPPGFDASRELLPSPYWEGNDRAIRCYWKVWELAFKNLRTVSEANGFVSPFIDTAFNDCLFAWDSVFILHFCKYGGSAFHFQGTLDNFYAKQHPDGFIGREIHEWDGHDHFHRHDPASTGPNVFAWSEWEYYLQTGDRDRLRDVFVPLVGYHRWMRRHRSWPDGSYWSCGLGCGMDNQPRTPAGYEPHVDHGHLSWIDATAQAAFSARLLSEMARELGTPVEDITAESVFLAEYVNERLWDEQHAFYFDRKRDGEFSDTMTIGAYWTLLAGLVPETRRERFVQHLRDPGLFNRPHRVPSLAANHPGYREDGGYWLGGVWAPTNYMVLRSLTLAGEDQLAHEIAMNHHANVCEVFGATETIWENYAPETAAPGKPAKRDFVGWSGLGPVAVLFEYVFGLRANLPENRLVLDVRLREPYGIKRYPFGTRGMLDIEVRPQADPLEEPQVTIHSSQPVDLELRWPGGVRILRGK